MPAIYIHIPFCKRKCQYCDFYSIVDTSMMEKYIEALITEITIRSQAKQGNQNNQGVSSIFIGGGTPSLVPAKLLGKVIDKLRQTYNFTDDIEVSIETNPTSIDIDYLRDLKSIGINRISLGVQSLDNQELKFLGRLHDSKTALKAIDAIQESGFENSNCDFIYSIPRTAENSEKPQIINSLKQVISLAIPHISIYSLTYEGNTPFTQKLNAGLLKPLSDNADFDQYMDITNLLNENGYYHYEISNYAKPDYECKHNINYWVGGEYLGFGCAAHSYSDKQRAWNIKKVAQYIEMMQKSDLSISKTEDLSKEDILFEKLFLGFRYSGVDLSELQYNQNPNTTSIISMLLNENKANIINKKLRLTAEGYYITDEIAIRLYDALVKS